MEVRRPVRRRGGRLRGQVLPLTALLLVILAGFAALTLDAGVAYNQTRTGQDLSDAAALAATYYIYTNENNTGASIGKAYTAAQNVANLDCTGPSYPCTTITINFYGSSYTPSSPGTPLCTAASQSAASNCGTSISQVAYVLVQTQSTAHDYFANLGKSGSKSFNVGNSAVAQVVGGPAGENDGQEYLSCVICLLAQQGGNGFTVPSGANDLDLTTSGGTIDINGGFDCEGGTSGSTADNVTINTKNGSVNGSVNISGSVTDNCSLTWNPATRGSPNIPTTGTTPIADPLANMVMPAPNYYGGTTSNPCIATETITKSTTLAPGCYGQITIDPTNLGSGNDQQMSGCPAPGDGIQVVLDSGLYIIYGGLTLEGDAPTITSQVCDSANGGDTLDFVCQTSNYNGSGKPGPAACASGGQTGAELELDPNGLENGQETQYAYQWNIFPPTSGQWANMIILYDRNNTSPIITATAVSDPDSDHNGGIYARDSTYEVENYSSSGTPTTTTGNTQTTPLGSPIVVNYMTLWGDYSQSGGLAFGVSNDVEVPAGGPGGLVS